MDDYRTVAADFQEGTRIPAELSALLEPLIHGKVSELAFSFAQPVDKFDLDPCIFCQTPITTFQLHSGEWFDVEVATDDQGVTRAELTHPHRCAESQRFDEFLREPCDQFEPEGDL